MVFDSTHMALDASRDIKLKSTDKMNSTIFDSFAKIINKQDAVRRDGGVALLKHLHEHPSDLNDNKECKYAMTRLIRGLGSSKLYAKKGFYSTLTTFLITHPDVSIDTILTTMDTELHPVNSNAKSEKADIYMGRILTCGALIRSKLLLNSTTDTQSKVVEILLNAGKQRSYLSFVSISFLIEFINQLNADSVKTSIWPLMENEFGKPWAEQTLDSFYALLVIRDKFPALVNQDFLKKYLSSNDIITKENINNIVNILTDLPRIKSCHHPVFVLFCEKLAATDLVVDFWLAIDRKFKKPSKTHEHVAIEILKHLLVHLNDKTVFPSLLSTDFLQHMLKKCSILKRNNNDEVVVAFKDLLNLLITSVKDIKTKIQINVLKKLILYPGDLMIEKKTGVKIIQLITGNLNADGVKKLSNLYRSIIENTISKERESSQTESWTNAERIYAVQLLTRLITHPAILSDQEWKLNQLKFLFLFGFCEVPQVGVELVPHFKDSFYRALDHKMPKLNDLRNMLSALVHYLNTELNSENIKLRIPLSEESEAAWKKAIRLIEKLENNPNAKAIPIFHTMYLHMGLQLFSDSEVAVMSINELQSCYDRVKKKSKLNNNKKLEDEPEWVEVVIDLLLSLLSKNSHLMRSLVTCVFPHICPYIVSMSEILSISKKTNPLSMNGDDNEESSGSDEDDENYENNVEEHNTEVTTDSSDESDMDCDKEDENKDEDETVTDMLRVAVSQALGGANPDNNDEDMDVDKIDEDEGKRLDESLAAAFKILRQNRRGQSKKQEKSAQALTHFRARVTDLLEIYLDCNPTMAVVLDMLVPLFALLEFCIKDPHQKPLENRVRSCLKKLSTIKKFRDTEGVDNELLTIILKTLIEKGERSASVCQEMGDKLAECCAFLIRCVQYVGLPDDTFVDIYKTNLTAFFKKRDCILPGILFKSLLQQSWEGNWQLAPLLVEYAFDLNTIRSFRRSQALEFLTIFYKNNRLIRSESTKNKNRIKMEKKLCENSINLLQDLCNANECKDEQLTSDENCSIKINQKFVYLFLTLLHTIHGQHLQGIWKWETIKEKLAKYRTKAVLSKDAKSAYNRLAKLIGLSLNCPAKKQETDSIPKVNGQISNVKKKDEKDEKDEQDEQEEQKEEAVIEVVDDEENSKEINKAKLKKKKKNKSKQKEKQLLKKESRELRLQTISEGLDVFQFSSSVNLPNEINETNSIQNDLPVVETNGISKHKRLPTDNLNDFNIPKKKKKSKS
ncbi:myb-binding protein 1A-like protein [Polistes fuscatus]|uniref:myb-binding protein 1A-like protein n=1 Tax=Polistes fuscatus TaxID=30207 RepID=UPI001CA9B1EC|nr:myb-binding protein 1A-like protein [Polistes fuscatus]